MDELVSVLMSTYNENQCELRNSINSILYQTYGNLEIIIINDNPENDVIDRTVRNIQDSRIVYIKNEKNKGLVGSLNTGLKYAHGSYIARMDADDIAEKKRIETQLKYLKSGNFDLVGCAINYIDETGNNLDKIEKFPVGSSQIKKRNRWKQCVAHPTFLAKKKVYDSLSGYRNVAYCEDYDFICRAIYTGYKIGNTPEVLLNYRVRSNSISKQNMLEQKVRSYFIGKLGGKITKISEKEILSFFSSEQYKKELSLCNSFYAGKEMIKSKTPKSVIIGLKMVCNKYLIYALMRKLYK